MLKISITFLLVTLVAHKIVCPPVVPEAEKKTDHDVNKDDPLHKLEYSRYLKEVVNVLESDPEFKKMIENASVEDIKSGKISAHLDLVGHNVRTQLDELKRQEIDRLTKLIARQMKLKQMQPHEIEALVPKHLDHQVSEFSANDLEKLIRQATTDLEEIDKRRKEEFKQYELEKEYERRQELEKMDAEHRKKAEEEYKKDLERRQHHEKVNHPLSEDQLEEVWEKEDQIDQEFDPRTFFALHDTNSDNVWDEDEVEALFTRELDKIYNSTNGTFDPNERFEEMNRMREHVFNEIDQDKNKVITLEEFVESTKQKDFKKNEDWETLEDHTQFNDQEFENFSRTHVNETDAPPTTLKPDHH